MKPANPDRSPAALIVGTVLLLVHGAVASWAVAGLVELTTPAQPWPAISNPELPTGVLLTHWLLMLAAGSLFVIGYLGRWRHTPPVMAVAYAGLATMCAVETFGLLTNESRFLDMGIEYLTYAVLLALLYNVPPLRSRFRRPVAVMR